MRRSTASMPCNFALWSRSLLPPFLPFQFLYFPLLSFYFLSVLEYFIVYFFIVCQFAAWFEQAVIWHSFPLFRILDCAVAVPPLNRCHNALDYQEPRDKDDKCQNEHAARYNA